MKRILLIKLRYLGDVVLSTPLLPLLRKHFPEANITFLVNPGTAGVLQDNPYLDEVWVMPRQSSWWQQLKFIRRLRGAKFDAVVDLTDGDRSAFLSCMTGAPTRIGYNREHRWRGKFYTYVVPASYGAMHMVDYHQQALVGLGIKESVGSPEVSVDPGLLDGDDEKCVEFPPKGQPLVLLHPTARYVFKAWPLERFASVADWLSGQGMGVALIGSQRERPIGQQIVNLAKHKPVNLMGKTRLSQLTALMKRSLLFIGNDGGPMHMAAAVGCQVLGLFGPTDPAVWGPRGEKVKVIYKGIDCEECFHPGCSRGEESCMRQITVEEVCQAAQSMLPSLTDAGSTFVRSKE